MPTRCLSVAQVAGLLDCSTRHVYDLIEAGQLPAVRVGERRLSVTEAAYEAFVASRSTVAA